MRRSGSKGLLYGSPVQGTDEDLDPHERERVLQTRTPKSVVETWLLRTGVEQEFKFRTDP